MTFSRVPAQNGEGYPLACSLRLTAGTSGELGSIPGTPRPDPSQIVFPGSPGCHHDAAWQRMCQRWGRVRALRGEGAEYGGGLSLISLGVFDRQVSTQERRLAFSPENGRWPACDD